LSIHQADLANRLARFLDRRQMPRRIEGKPQAVDDELAALTAKLVRYAPRGADAVAAWWPVFEDKLGEVSPGGLWPTEREIADCAKAAVADAADAMRPFGTTGDDAFGSPEWSRRVWQSRFSAGMPVAETMLYGRAAVELIAEGRVDRETMERNRSGAFFARSALYGDAAAREWEAEAKARHDAARAVHKARNSPRSTRDTTADVNPMNGADDAD
jgi:hypothetical protein